MAPLVLKSLLSVKMVMMASASGLRHVAKKARAIEGKRVRVESLLALVAFGVGP